MKRAAITILIYLRDFFDLIFPKTRFRAHQKATLALLLIIILALITFVVDL